MENVLNRVALAAAVARESSYSERQYRKKKEKKNNRMSVVMSVWARAVTRTG